MKHMLYAAMLFSIAITGCTSQSSNADTEENTATQNADEGAEGEGMEVALTPENTKIQFVGTHTDKEKPDPRTGHFSEFTGKAKINKGSLTSLNVDIKTSSLKTNITKLTNHLKSPDFFDVREHPQATFQSTAIKADKAGQIQITGNLTLLGVTKSITFPATVSTKDGLSLKSAFKIDRTKFGMNYGLEGVEKDVDMTVTIGK